MSQFMVGASCSINKTRRDIDRIMQGLNLSIAGPLRNKLRDEIEQAMIEAAMRALEHGFRGGHIVAAKRFAKTGTFPVTIRKQVQRRLPVVGVSPNQYDLSLRSKLPDDVAASLADEE